MLRLALAFALLPAVAIAQSATVPQVPVPPQTTEELIRSMPDDIDPSIFIGAPLLSNEEKYELTKAPEFQFQPSDYLVIEGGDIKATGAWSAADTAACEASGGEVLPLPAGRQMCFRF